MYLHLKGFDVLGAYLYMRPQGYLSIVDNNGVDAWSTANTQGDGLEFVLRDDGNGVIDRVLQNTTVLWTTKSGTAPVRKLSPCLVGLTGTGQKCLGEGRRSHY